MSTAATPTLPFQNSYAQLPDRFHARATVRPVRAPRLIRLNTELSEFLGLDPAVLASPEGVAILAGNVAASGSEPLALAYAGHQFGNFVPQLGDGRAMLLGEVLAGDGKRYDVQLKGSGPTAFSRRGDGRAALGPVLREYVLSEAMHALGIPTTRALAAVLTGEQVQRETLQPGAVFARVAASHIRVGTFQYFAARNDVEGLRALLQYAIERHYAEAAEAGSPALAFLHGVIGRQARLIARWMLVGFIHGVMNTDNMAISGETIDYGPCAFLEAYDPGAVFSYIDQNGRYAYANQPDIALWNLTRLAETLLPLLGEQLGGEGPAMEAAKAALEGFAPQFLAAWNGGLRAKIGLATEQEGDNALTGELLETMAAGGADFTLTFRRLSQAALDPGADSAFRALFEDAAAFDVWAQRWRQRLAAEPGSPAERRTRMRAVNPAVIPRNHRVEEAIAAAVRAGDFQPFETLLDSVTQPFADRPETERYQQAARPEERVTQTFCGT